LDIEERGEQRATDVASGREVNGSHCVAAEQTVAGEAIPVSCPRRSERNFQTRVGFFAHPSGLATFSTRCDATRAGQGLERGTNSNVGHVCVASFGKENVNPGSRQSDDSCAKLQLPTL